MNSYGNRREIQQGEDFNIDIKVSASDREYIPFIVSSERHNPYFVLTVASTKYEKNLRYVASWWNSPEGKSSGEPLPRFYQTTPVDIGVLSTAPTSTFKPSDIPSQYQTDESFYHRYLYRYMLESESVESKTGHKPYHYFYFEYPQTTGELVDGEHFNAFINGFYGYNRQLPVNIHFGAKTKEQYNHRKNTTADWGYYPNINETTESGILVRISIGKIFDIKTGLFVDGIEVYILPSDFDTPIVFNEDCSNMFASNIMRNHEVYGVYFDNVDLSKVKNMKQMFANAYSLREVQLDGVSADSCETMEKMFYGCNNLLRVSVNDTLLGQIEDGLDGNLSTKDFFTGVYNSSNSSQLTGRDGSWTSEEETEYTGVNLPYSEIYNYTLESTDDNAFEYVDALVCHNDDYECHIRFNLDSDVTGEWNGQEYQYAITLVDGPTLVATLQTIAMANNGGVLPSDYPTNLAEQYEYVKVKYPNQLSTDIDVTSPLGKIEHPESILRPSDLKVYNNLRKLI